MKSQPNSHWKTAPGQLCFRCMQQPSRSGHDGCVVDRSPRRTLLL